MSNQFRDARNTMARYLDEDEGLRTAYAANVQMLLQDNGVQQETAAPLARKVLALVFFTPKRPGWVDRVE